MSIFKCKMCGGDLTVTNNEKVVECEYCGSKQTVPDTNDEKKINLYNRANRLRISCEFDKAAGIYEQIIAEFPEEAEAYWGLCLSNYGIEYVDDPSTAKKIPTCHRASFDKMRKDENYEHALENADMTARIVYEDQAKEIDRIMSEILSVSRDEKPYDIFICYKETDNRGSRTPDSVLAQDIYDALSAKDYRVFFSRITLEDKLGTQYEPYIFSALNSAKIMLVVGTDYEYLNAVWVKNEWSRFIKIMAKDKSKTLIPCYKDMDPYDMPDEFKPYQSQDCSKLGFIQDLVRGIDKLFGITEQTKTVEKVIIQQNGGNATASSLLERAFMFLEDGKWNDAIGYCEKVLDLEPKNAMAYVGKLMAHLKVKKEAELGNCSELFSGNENYKKAVSFDENVKTRLEGYIEAINSRIKEAEEHKRKQEEEADNLFNRLIELGKLKYAEENVASLEEKKRKITADCNAEILELEKSKKYYTELKRNSEELNSEFNELNSQAYALQDKRQALENELSSLGLFAGKKRKELKDTIKNVGDQFADVQKKISALQDRIEPMNSKLREHESIESIQQKIDSANERISNIEAEHNAMIEKFNKIQQEENLNADNQLSLEEVIEKINSRPDIKDIIENNKHFIILPEVFKNKLGLKNTFGSYPQEKKRRKSPDRMACD